MTTFPALIPSSRVFTPGEYPATAFSAFSGVQNRVRHSNVLIAAQLQLSFIGLPEADMLAIWQHYANRQGGFQAFALPAEIVSNGSITDYVPGVYLWRYAGPGVVEDLPCGGHNITLTLETVPPVAANVIGVDLRVVLSLAAGAGAAGEYVAGIAESVSLSFSGGSASDALNGIAASISLSLSPGIAVGDSEPPGIASTLILSLSTGAAANTGRPGINQSIALGLAAGAADSGVPTDPNFSSVSLLLHMDGSNGSTTFTDSSSNTLSVTNNGTPPEIRTAESKFGGASCFFGGTSNRWLVLPSATALDCTADFTIEAWVYPLATSDMMVASGLSGNTQVFRLNSGGAGRILCFAGGVMIVDTAAGISANAWQHLAMTRSGTSTRVFVGGVQRGSTNTSFTGSLYVQRIGMFFFNGFASNPQLNYNGYIDDFRVTKGVARYTANFTPPTAPFPDA